MKEFQSLQALALKFHEAQRGPQPAAEPSQAAAEPSQEADPTEQPVPPQPAQHVERAVPSPAVPSPAACGKSGAIPEQTVTVQPAQPSARTMPAQTAQPSERTVPAQPTQPPAVTLPAQRAQPSQELLPERPVATPSRQSHPKTIADVDTSPGVGQVLQGKISSRVNHAKGGGFHFRIADSSGEVDVKFWKGAADKFMDDARLRVGNTVRLSGFSFCRLREGKDTEFAPAGRKHSLNFNSAPEVQVEFISGSSVSHAAGPVAGPVTIKTVLASSPGMYCDIKAWIKEVEFEAMQTEKFTRRSVWVVEDLTVSCPAVRWTLWGQDALAYGPKQLQGRQVTAKRVMVKEYRGQKELTSCQKGSIQIIA